VIAAPLFFSYQETGARRVANRPDRAGFIVPDIEGI